MFFLRYYSTHYRQHIIEALQISHILSQTVNLSFIILIIVQIHLPLQCLRSSCLKCCMLPLWFRPTVIYVLSCSLREKHIGAWVQLFTKYMSKRREIICVKSFEATLRRVFTRLRAWLYSQTDTYTSSCGHHGAVVWFMLLSWSPHSHTHRRILSYCSCLCNNGTNDISSWKCYRHCHF